MLSDYDDKILVSFINSGFFKFNFKNNLYIINI